MASRPESGRVTKLSSVRRRVMPMAGNFHLAELLANEDVNVDVLGSTNDILETREADGGPVHEPASMEGPQDTEAMMIDGQEHSAATRDKGKGGRAVDVAEERLFPFMELPTELRLEVYRACLTRPYKILLSKAVEPRSEPYEADGELTDGDVDMSSGFEDNGSSNASLLQRLRAQRGISSPRPANSLSLVARTARTPNQSRPSSHLGRHGLPRRRQSNTIRFSLAGATPPPQLPTATSANASSTGPNNLAHQFTVRGLPGRSTHRLQKPTPSSRSATPKSADPLIVNILRTNKAVYKEARGLLYSENQFDLSIDTAVPSLAALHQRSRRLIRHVELEIPSYTEIQDKFSEVVRLSLRYCSGLRKLVIHTPFCLPGGDGTATPNSNTQIWAQGFDILRWLPQQCEVVLLGQKNVEIEEVVNKHLHLAKTLSPVAYAHRQLIPSDSGGSSQTTRLEL